MNTFTITAALPYANGPLHIGHLAGAYLHADIYARYQRAKGHDVIFICGSDEHGAAITIKAKQEGLTPQEICDKYHEQFKNTFKKFNISFDIFYRTTDPNHHACVQEFFEYFLNSNQLESKKILQYFDENYQQFLPDRYIIGTCPTCNNENAYGDQCEKCGRTLDPLDLTNPKSTLSNTIPVLKETEHWYFPLQNFQKDIEEFIHSHPEWKAHVKGQCESWLQSGLTPRCITRDLSWGVKIPNHTDKVVYVWFDAPIGYISATKAWAELNNKDWKTYWKDKNTKLIHFIGKDNIVFHCIIFPAMLIGRGDYILPHNVPANQFLNLEGQKISTSKNWAIWLDDWKYSEDSLRYYLICIGPEINDSNFIWNDYYSHHNNELVAILGNFVNRTVHLIHKFYNGIIPNIQPLNINTENNIDKYIEEYKFKDAMNAIINIARIGNKYLQQEEPWKQQDPKICLSTCAQLCLHIAIYLSVFLPQTSEKLRTLLNINELSWNDFNKSIQNHKINSPEKLFEKYSNNFIQN